MKISKITREYLIKNNLRHIAWGHSNELHELYDILYGHNTDDFPKSKYRKIINGLDRENYKDGIQKPNALFTKRLSQIGEDGKWARVFILNEYKDTWGKFRKEN